MERTELKIRLKIAAIICPIVAILIFMLLNPPAEPMQTEEVEDTPKMEEAAIEWINEVKEWDQSELELRLTGVPGTNVKITGNGWEFLKEGSIDESGSLNMTVSFTTDPIVEETSYKLRASNEGYEEFIDYLFISNSNYDPIAYQQHQDELAAQEQAEKDQLAAEEDTQAEARQAAWRNSEAGQICAAHPEWWETDCSRIADNKIWIGMTLEMLKYERGNPSSTDVSNYGSGNEYQYCWWNYTPSCFYDDDEDGKMDSYN